VKHSKRLTCERDRGGNGQNREDKRAAYVPHPTGSYPSPLDNEPEIRRSPASRTLCCGKGGPRVDHPLPWRAESPRARQ
jgi:hypothetical protein